MPRDNRPKTEDVLRRMGKFEHVEEKEHQVLRECLGHDDLPKISKYSNLSEIQPVETGDFRTDPSGPGGPGYVKSDEDN